jgi:phospholipid/cholesterol/gamma-HCH transport system permease protein
MTAIFHSVYMTKEFFALAARTIGETFRAPYRIKDIVRQIQFMSIESLPMVTFCLCFAAVVTIIEASFHMKLVIQNDSLVPGFASLLIIRELGAVVPALLVTARVGAGLAAEVGSMRVTEQIEALQMLGIDPVRFLVVPRFVACILGTTLLTTIATLVCLFASMVVSQIKLGFSFGAYMMATRTFVQVEDIFFTMIKGAAFGAVIPLFSCFFGFRCKPGAEGVGVATTQSVVATSIAIIVIDFVLSWIFTYLY